MRKTQRRIYTLEAASVRDGQSQLQKEQSKVKRDNKKYFPKRRQKLVTLTHSFEKVSRRDKIRTLGQLDFFSLSLLHSCSLALSLAILSPSSGPVVSGLTRTLNASPYLLRIFITNFCQSLFFFLFFNIMLNAKIGRKNLMDFRTSFMFLRRKKCIFFFFSSKYFENFENNFIE